MSRKMTPKPFTLLSELQRIAKVPPSAIGGESPLVLSVEQSMRVEGYAVSTAMVRESLDRVLRDTK